MDVISSTRAPASIAPSPAQRLQLENEELQAYLHAQKVIVVSLERRAGRSLEFLGDHVQQLVVAASDDHRWQQQLQLVQNEVDCLSDLLADTLLLQRLEAGKVKVSREAIDVHTLMSTVTRHLAKPNQGYWSRLICEIDPVLPHAYADSDLTEAVLTDLVARALRYSEGEAPVVLTATRSGRQINLGVSAQQFAPPSNRDFATEIMLCCRRVEVQGGSITCEQHPNGLQTVAITLPTVEPLTTN